MMFTISSISNTTLVTNFLAVVGQLRPEQYGHLVMAYGALPLMPFTLLCVFLLRRIDSRLVLIVGLTCFALASLLATNLTAEWRTEDFIPVVVLQSAGHGFTFLAIIVTALANSNPARATAFAAYIQVLRLCGPLIGGAIMATWLRVLEQTHSNHLGRYLTSGDFNAERILAAFTERFQSADPALASQRALASLASRVQAQANVLAYIDGFWLTFSAAVIGIVAVGIMKPSPPGPFTPKR